MVSMCLLLSTFFTTPETSLPAAAVADDWLDGDWLADAELEGDELEGDELADDELDPDSLADDCFDFVSVDDDGLDADSLDELWDGVWADVEEPELVSCCELPPPAPTASKPAAATPIMAFIAVHLSGSSHKASDRRRRREVRASAPERASACARSAHWAVESSRMRHPVRLRRGRAYCDIRCSFRSRGGKV
jgi:hypothetical protein